jgi:hypothetical protein
MGSSFFLCTPKNDTLERTGECTSAGLIYFVPLWAVRCHHGGMQCPHVLVPIPSLLPNQTKPRRRPLHEQHAYMPRSFLFTVHHVYNCTSFCNILTSSPGLKGGNPTYGHPSHRNASPKAQFPHEPTFPFTVKSTSVRSLTPSLAAGLAAGLAWALMLLSFSVAAA